MTHQKQLENAQYFIHLDSVITNDARFTCEIISRIVVAKAAFNKMLAVVASKLDLNLRKKLVECCIGSKALCAAGEGWRTTSVEPIM
jgi:hypothetical protein